jgi:tRNA threonylcarbamoyladenosine biosynthesis protein TsaB
MLLLAVDTSGKNGSLALTRVASGQPNVDVIEVVPLTGGTFSAQLIPQLSALLAKHEYSKSDIAAFAAASGPGSFTGLRVGLAAIKGLAEVLQKPIAAVSLLEALACSTVRRVLAALDAGRSEIYVGDYDVAVDEFGVQANPHSERLLSRDEFLAEARGRFVVTPDAALTELLHASGISSEHVDPSTAADVARLGWQHILRGQIVPPDALEANYIRRSDAEIFSKPQSVNPPMQTTIRPATTNDVPAIVALERQVANASHWSRKQYESRLKDGFLLVAESDSQLVGFICARPLTGECEIENVVVREMFRRKGIASVLLQALVDTARKTGNPTFHLEVRASNIAAQQLYEKHGFQPAGKRPNYYRDPREDAILYTRSASG